MVAPSHRASARRLSNRVAAEAVREATMQDLAPPPSMVIHDDEVSDWGGGGSAASGGSGSAGSGRGKDAGTAFPFDDDVFLAADGAAADDGIGAVEVSAAEPSNAALLASPPLSASSSTAVAATATAAVPRSVSSSPPPPSAFADEGEEPEGGFKNTTGKEAALAEIARIRAMRRVSNTSSPAVGDSARGEPALPPPALQEENEGKEEEIEDGCGGSAVAAPVAVAAVAATAAPTAAPTAATAAPTTPTAALTAVTTATAPRTAVELYDKTVSPAFVQLVEATTALAANVTEPKAATTATEMLREGTFMQRQFLRIAPQVQPDHFEAKRIMHETNDLLIRARFHAEDVEAGAGAGAGAGGKTSTKGEVAYLSAMAVATVSLIEAFGWVRVGRFAQDPSVSEHVAQHVQIGISALSQLETAVQHTRQYPSAVPPSSAAKDAARQWAAAYRLIAQGLGQMTDAFHSPAVAWNSATPEADFEQRPFTPLPPTMERAEAAQIEADRAAFAERLAVVAADKDAASRLVADAEFLVDTKLGSGAFGKVLLVSQRTGANAKVALKVMVKANIMEGLQAEQVLNESTILSCLDHPFIVKSPCKSIY